MNTSLNVVFIHCSFLEIQTFDTDLRLLHRDLHLSRSLTCCLLDIHRCLHSTIGRLELERPLGLLLVSHALEHNFLSCCHAYAPATTSHFGPDSTQPYHLC